MAVEAEKSGYDGKLWSLFKIPFWQSGNASSSSSSSSSSTLSSMHHNVHHQLGHESAAERTALHSASTVSYVTKSLLPARRRLRLDPPNKLFFPYEPGKQVRSAIGIKNTSKTIVAFKFQTTAPKSCYMRPPGGILAPGEDLIATVFKFVEPPENDEKPAVDQKSRVKFKIMSLKVKGDMDYVPELFDEQRDQVVVEQVLRVVFLDPERPTPAMEKLERQLAEAEASLESRKKPPQEAGPRIVGEGLVIDEWKERRERYLAQQQVEGVDSV
ncbi:vesicle-associated protein 4-2 [Pyrus x bretschneideri]|uniref:vesicle-associated protein 4-2 n=1 Tax=Pyrus x bretschneideri TaxID=225117 RepID=UPI000510ED73|nr:vesicle-associated protein 4-2 [Pyrus x bretschneideri]XP_048433527.1 vesicle-associated protein 4-2 [Pyrus x bretschneideri]